VGKLLYSFPRTGRVTDELFSDSKYVPKLLKELQSTGKVADTQITFLNDIKTAVVQKKQVEDRDVQQLKHMGQQCMEA
jgi:hypothetical protein